MITILTAIAHLRRRWSKYCTSLVVLRAILCFIDQLVFTTSIFGVLMLQGFSAELGESVCASFRLILACIDFDPFLIIGLV